MAFWSKAPSSRKTKTGRNYGAAGILPHAVNTNDSPFLWVLTAKSPVSKLLNGAFTVVNEEPEPPTKLVKGYTTPPNELPHWPE